MSLLGSLGIEKLLFYSHPGFPFLIVAATVSGRLHACTSRGDDSRDGGGGDAC